MDVDGGSPRQLWQQRPCPSRPCWRSCRRCARWRAGYQQERGSGKVYGIERRWMFGTDGISAESGERVLQRSGGGGCGESVGEVGCWCYCAAAVEGGRSNGQRCTGCFGRFTQRDIPTRTSRRMRARPTQHAGMLWIFMFDASCAKECQSVKRRCCLHFACAAQRT